MLPKPFTAPSFLPEARPHRDHLAPELAMAAFTAGCAARPAAAAALRCTLNRSRRGRAAARPGDQLAVRRFRQHLTVEVISRERDGELAAGQPDGVACCEHRAEHRLAPHTSSTTRCQASSLPTGVAGRIGGSGRAVRRGGAAATGARDVGRWTAGGRPPGRAAAARRAHGGRRRPARAGSPGPRRSRGPGRRPALAQPASASSTLARAAPRWRAAAGRRRGAHGGDLELDPRVRRSRIRPVGVEERAQHVEELVGGRRLRRPPQLVGLGGGQVGELRGRRRLEHEQPAQQLDDVRGRTRRDPPPRGRPGRSPPARRRLVGDERLDEGAHLGRRRGAEQPGHGSPPRAGPCRRRWRCRAATARRAATLGGAHERAAARPARRARFSSLRMRLERRRQQLGRDRPEVEALQRESTVAGMFARVGGGQDEDDVRGRLLQRLEERVEGGAGEQVHLVDDVDLVAAAGRRVLDVLAQGADLLDAAVGGGVDLDDVHRRAGRSGSTGHAPQASVAVRSGHASALARSRAVVVLPMPRGPAKR